MKRHIIMLTPLALLALAGCGQSREEKAEAAKQAEVAAEEQAAETMMAPPPITSQGVYRCKDNTIVYVDFLGDNVAANVRVGEKSGVPTNLTAPAPAEPAADGAAAPAASGELVSADGTMKLTGGGKEITLTLPGKSAQACKK
ncbi:MAG: hypothetical protein U5J78_07610 [Parasphingorhabdus sp.]|nr:hypothetical protein [Parasphingorhabdus sp.]